jgi:hypothetical protein
VYLESVSPICVLVAVRYEDRITLSAGGGPDGGWCSSRTAGVAEVLQTTVDVISLVGEPLYVTSQIRRLGRDTAANEKDACVREEAIVDIRLRRRVKAGVNPEVNVSDDLVFLLVQAIEVRLQRMLEGVGIAHSPPQEGLVGGG